MSLHPIVSVDEIDPSEQTLRVCDLRWDLTDPEKGRVTYERGHIPGAVFVDLDQDLAGPPGVRGRHPLPDVDEFTGTLGRLGISPDSHVVVYDDVGGPIAARLWWMLRAIGHDNVQVLDGGYQAWIEAGNDVGVGTVTPHPTHYPSRPGFEGVVDHGQLDGRLVVDARSNERYRGDYEPVDPKAGHIPGAINIPTSRNLGDDGRLLGGTELTTIYSGLDSPVVSCGSGVTACHAALAMVLAGHEMPDVYVGSFSEWSRLDLPVVAGPDP